VDGKGSDVVAFSPDGATLLVAGDQSKALLWDVRSGTPAGEFGNHTGPITAATFSPDGRMILTAGKDGRACLWDAVTRKPIGLPFVHPAEICSASFSPNGRLVATGAPGGYVRLWNVATGRLEFDFRAHTDPVLGLAFSPDGKTIATAGGRNGRLWNAATGKAVGQPLAHTSLVVAVVFDASGSRVLTADANGVLKFWRSAEGVPLDPSITSSSGFCSAAISRDRKTVITGGNDGTVRLWDAETGKLLHTPLGGMRDVNAVAFSPDGTAFAAASMDGTAMLCGVPPTGLAGEITQPFSTGALAFAPDGRRLLTAGAKISAGLTGLSMQEPEARLWDVGSLREEGRPLPHNYPVLAASFDPRDGNRVVTGAGEFTKLAGNSGEGEARVWDIAAGKSVFLKHARTVTGVAFTPDGKVVVTSSHGEGGVRCWDSATGRLLGLLIKCKAFEDFQCVAVSPDGSTILTGSSDRTAQLWDAVTGRPIGAPFVHGQTVLGVAFSPDGTKIVTGCADSAVQLWDVESGKLLWRRSHRTGIIRAVAYSPDGREVVSGSIDLNRGAAEAQVWDAVTGKRLGPPLRHGGGSLSSVTAVAFDPRGRMIATGSADRSVRLWKRATPLEGDCERIVLWTQVITGKELDAFGEVQNLDAAAWQERRQRLDALGGPPP
jgi:WD40 repeat protein